MKLYFVPQTRSTRPRWVLEELGVPYELVRLDPSKGDNKRPEYLAVHPLGHVPALDDGGLHMVESAAICQYLADKYPERQLAPAVGTPERGAYYQWMMFTMTTVEPPLVSIAEHRRFLPEAERIPEVAERAERRFAEVAGVVQSHLAGREYVVGTHFTAADVVLASALAWGGSMGLLGGFDGLQAYVKRMTARPAAQKARSA